MVKYRKTLGYRIVSATIVLASLSVAVSGDDKPADLSSAGSRNTCRLILPAVVYGVAGTEVNLYFQNLILTPPGRIWIFDVSCTKGKQPVERWTWLPGDH